MKQNIWLDAMMGLIVGDALGCPVQFYTREEIKNRPNGPVVGMEAGGVYDMPEGTWTDDSSMAIATVASIIEKGTVDQVDIMKKFMDWEFEGAYTPFGEAFDEGNTCCDAIYKYRDNSDIRTCGATGEYANGNGSLMRIMPACLYYYTKNKDFEAVAVQGIHMISGLTHNHFRAKMCCGIYYFMTKRIIDCIFYGEKQELQGLLQSGIDDGLKYYGQYVQNLEEMSHLKRLFHLNEFKEVPATKIKTTGYVIDALEAAIWCLINTDSYKDCMLVAVNLGDDTDTIAAIAGGLAGLYYGYESIPKEWLAVIQRREWIEDMCQRVND